MKNQILDEFLRSKRNIKLHKIINLLIRDRYLNLRIKPSNKGLRMLRVRLTPVACHRVSRRIGFCSSLVSHHHHHLRLPLLSFSSTWNRGREFLPSFEGCGPAFLCWMGTTYQGGTREVGGSARCVTERACDDIASLFSSFLLLFLC